MHKETPASDMWKRTSAKKNTRAWCKGKEGREHVLKIVITKWPYRPTECGWRWDVYPWTKVSHARDPGPWTANRWECFHIEQCSVCGKHLQNPLDPSRCPARLTV